MVKLFKTELTASGRPVLLHGEVERGMLDKVQWGGGAASHAGGGGGGLLRPSTPLPYEESSAPLPADTRWT